MHVLYVSSDKSVGTYNVYNERKTFWRKFSKTSNVITLPVYDVMSTHGINFTYGLKLSPKKSDTAPKMRN
jgi:hypothetical protein